MGVVDTPGRFTRLLSWLAVFTAAITVVSVLQYHGVVQFPSIEFVQDSADESGDEGTMFARLGATGLFQDPNDMSQGLVVGIAICLYEIIERRRPYWLALMAPFFHVLC